MPTFHRVVTLHRFIHAPDADTAHERAHHGMQIDRNMPPDRFSIVESALVEHTAVLPYLHAGEDDDLWQVSIKVSARLRTANALAATEAAHQLVTVDPRKARDDAFEFEIQVSDDEHQIRLAG
ncbi:MULTISPECIES: hypothetical protein [Mycobacteroides]|uniref:Uncharacterized protein n=1 Tax=Mycobacteroides saopaulense TaxID=1578165 RepID=A0ABX3BSF3_9MYCO|nr:MULTISPECIES: hypothetical protein [Mycobacteroides]MDB2196284.1 hypothetical protein [Mycobacteroides abscessus subsp. abscessus]MDB2199878.1 hypothetical protein [Mycobacteroides abscessus subsp. abscessus]OHT87547.1 hypothetical protein BKG68_05675 [Mycobacteroides saopaulense]OHU05891.1 hypothetical protein BKG73_19820 [Mycobacteroides saopaulense]CPS21844.1 Uncharacterised protein [Mycobacteroides abscessus]